MVAVVVEVKVMMVVVLVWVEVVMMVEMVEMVVVEMVEVVMMVVLVMLVVVVASGGVGVGVRDDRVHDPGLGHAAQSTRLQQANAASTRLGREKLGSRRSACAHIPIKGCRFSVPKCWRNDF